MINVNEQKFMTTAGVYELLFKNNPASHTNDDMNTFLEPTNVHKHSNHN